MRWTGVLIAGVLCVAVAGCSGGSGVGAGRDRSGDGADSSVGGPGWSTLPASPLAARQGMVAVAIGDRFVIVGGSVGLSCPPNASCLASPDGFRRDGAVFDPATGGWRSIAEAPVRISSYRTAVLGDSLYLITVPDPTLAEEVFLRYDLGDDTWTTLPDPPSPGSDLVATEDRVLAVANTDEFCETRDGAFSPETGRWTPLPDDPLGPSFNRGAAWLGDRLLLTGQRLVDNPGADGPSLTRMAELDANLTTWTGLPDSPIIGGTPIAVGGKVVFPTPGSADGGEVGNWGRSYDYGGIWDISTGSWRPLPAGESRLPQDGDELPALAAVGDGGVLIGNALLDPVAATWTRLPLPPLSVRHGQAVAVGPRSVLVWGGTDAGFTRNLNDGALFTF